MFWMVHLGLFTDIFVWLMKLLWSNLHLLPLLLLCPFAFSIYFLASKAPHLPPSSNFTSSMRLSLTQSVLRKVSVSYPTDFLSGSDGKASAHNAGDPGSILGSGRSLGEGNGNPVSLGEGNGNPLQYSGEGNGNPLQYSCLENLMDGGAWLATVHGVAKMGSQRVGQDWATSLSTIGLTALNAPLNKQHKCDPVSIFVILHFNASLTPLPDFWSLVSLDPGAPGLTAGDEGMMRPNKKRWEALSHNPDTAGGHH